MAPKEHENNPEEEEEVHELEPEIHEDEVPDEAGEIESIPDLSENWCEGKFIININRCHQCILHYDFCRHSEDEYVTAFNEMVEAITLNFP